MSALVGCDRPYPFYYLSFESAEGMRIDRSETYKWLDLELRHAIPLEYRATRGSYEVRLRHDTTSYKTAVHVAVLGWSGAIRPRPDLTTADGATGPCARVFPPQPDGLEFEFMWEFCRTGSSAELRVLAFDLIDEEGTVVARERIRFEVKRGGTYWATDAI